jgi:hypothetical protein
LFGINIITNPNKRGMIAAIIRNVVWVMLRFVG